MRCFGSGTAASTETPVFAARSGTVDELGRRRQRLCMADVDTSSKPWTCAQWALMSRLGMFAGQYSILSLQLIFVRSSVRPSYTQSACVHQMHHPPFGCRACCLTIPPDSDEISWVPVPISMMSTITRASIVHFRPRTGSVRSAQSRARGGCRPRAPTRARARGLRAGTGPARGPRSRFAGSAARSCRCASSSRAARRRA
jgi:hypothetical protein